MAQEIYYKSDQQASESDLDVGYASYEGQESRGLMQAMNRRPSFCCGVLGAICGVLVCAPALSIRKDSTSERKQLDFLGMDNALAAGWSTFYEYEAAVDNSIEPDGCHDIKLTDHGPCMAEIKAAIRLGAIPNEKRFTGGTQGLRVPSLSDPLVEWQALVYKTSRGKCPMPCTSTRSAFCKSKSAPFLWAPAIPRETMQIKVLSYNLFWWNLFTSKKGIWKDPDTKREIHNSAGKLILKSMEPPYDVMGFQECEDFSKVLEPVGLLEQYEAFLEATHNICMAYRKDTWSLVARGDANVAEDQASEYYGMRAAQWMRLHHKKTGEYLFFVNHHGPLHVNSGGECGGISTAHNLLNLIANNAQHGDAIILVGDFNANAASLTIQELWKHLVLLFSGNSFAGVDNVFSNLGVSSLVETKIVGTGGSDHNATSVTVELGVSRTPTLLNSQVTHSAPLKAVKDSIDSECGLIEPGVEYSFQKNAVIQEVHGITDRKCCALCKRNTDCTAFVQVDWAHSSKGPRCTLYGGEIANKNQRKGVVSGLPPVTAMQAAMKAAAEAISEFPKYELV